MTNIRPGTLVRWYALKPILEKYTKNHMTILDIGGFDGYTLGKLKEKYNFFPILIDLDVIGLEIGKTKKIEPLLATGPQIPLNDKTVDMVLGLDVIEHVEEDILFIREVARIMKKKSLLVLTTPIKDKKIVPFMNMEQVHKQFGHVRFGYTKDELVKVLGDEGLEIIYNTTYFNILSRYFYYVLFLLNLPFSYNLKISLFKFFLHLERWFKIGGMEYAILAKK